MVLIVFLQQEVEMFVHQPLHFPHKMRWHATIPGECDRVQPKFALPVGAPDVDMGRLHALIRVKVETKTTDS
jgi:hypothetical protein